MNDLKIVLDTNALLVCISRNSKFRLIFDKFLDGYFELLVSTEILNEYVEKLQEKANSFVANNISEVLINAQNVVLVNVYYNWNIISDDPDDNKFIDCAVAADANFIVSNDRHFNILKKIDFPKINVITIEEFMQILQNQ
ncbi:MAG: putative toxin-antitoxin system toxin component, PIN family [Saprospiraceae bacterium]|nr:putative toxin-antitoxin system toxin component, PIN family [Saprospiraceae bacterium]MCF8250035.1 putative toxin-antitoxin system toxin component, PIN family [Saprospiraceae bacterium]MCF8278925.1 putative toxin-antitoxin system toxin component, PIN family [Bacteroidales bacterium]MCF8311048.1 putative toxin-antitoxin system toxin component, PIN family [Saprospiraceae bacterium]MCF8439616.1 putative toxin-antitoxin system toxin component, PIN family [Saprospiraceae bacterium]